MYSIFILDSRRYIPFSTKIWYVCEFFFLIGSRKFRFSLKISVNVLVIYCLFHFAFFVFFFSNFFSHFFTCFGFLRVAAFVIHQRRNKHRLSNTRTHTYIRNIIEYTRVSSYDFYFTVYTHTTHFFQQFRNREKWFSVV